MAKIPTWLRLFKFLDEKNEYNTFTELAKISNISWTAVSKNLKVLDELGVINIIEKGRSKKIIKTQKFEELRTTLNTIYKFLDGKNKKSVLVTISKGKLK